MNTANRRHYRLFAVAPAALLLSFAMHTAITPYEPHPTPTCQAMLEPDSVPIVSEPVRIGFTVPDSLGAITMVNPDAGAAITVVSIDNEGKAVTLNTQSAIEGSWPVTFTGDSARTCIGNLNVMPRTRR